MSLKENVLNYDIFSMDMNTCIFLKGGDKSTSLFLFHLCLSSSTLVAEHIGRAGGSILQNISMITLMIIITIVISKIITIMIYCRIITIGIPYIEQFHRRIFRPEILTH